MEITIIILFVLCGLLVVSCVFVNLYLRRRICAENSLPEELKALADSCVMKVDEVGQLGQGEQYEQFFSTMRKISTNSSFKDFIEEKKQLVFGDLGLFSKVYPILSCGYQRIIDDMMTKDLEFEKLLIKVDEKGEPVCEKALRGYLTKIMRDDDTFLDEDLCQIITKDPRFKKIREIVREYERVSDLKALADSCVMKVDEVDPVLCMYKEVVAAPEANKYVVRIRFEKYLEVNKRSLLYNLAFLSKVYPALSYDYQRIIDDMMTNDVKLEKLLISVDKCGNANCEDALCEYLTKIRCDDDTFLDEDLCQIIISDSRFEKVREIVIKKLYYYGSEEQKEWWLQLENKYGKAINH